jgi:hypothetical protein
MTTYPQAINPQTQGLEWSGLSGIPGDIAGGLVGDGRSEGFEKADLGTHALTRRAREYSIAASKAGTWFSRIGTYAGLGALAMLAPSIAPAAMPIAALAASTFPAATALGSISAATLGAGLMAEGYARIESKRAGDLPFQQAQELAMSPKFMGGGQVLEKGLKVASKVGKIGAGVATALTVAGRIGLLSSGTLGPLSAVSPLIPLAAGVVCHFNEKISKKRDEVYEKIRVAMAVRPEDREKKYNLTAGDFKYLMWTSLLRGNVPEFFEAWDRKNAIHNANLGGKDARGHTLGNTPLDTYEAKFTGLRNVAKVLRLGSGVVPAVLGAGALATLGAAASPAALGMFLAGGSGITVSLMQQRTWDLWRKYAYSVTKPYGKIARR